MLEAIVCGGILGIEILGVMLGGLLIQGITYWTTGFSIFNYLTKKLFTNK